MTPSPGSPPVDLDLACAVAVGIIEHPQMVVILERITLFDAHMQTLATLSDWINGQDPLHVAAREYLTAKRDAVLAWSKSGKTHWGYSGAAKTRDVANQQAIQAKRQARRILEERGVLQRARASGMTVFE